MSKVNWIPITGVAGIKEDVIIYTSKNQLDGEQKGLAQPLITVLGSNIDFENGEICFKVIFFNEEKERPACNCQIIFNSNTNMPQIFIGINNLGLYLIQKLSSNKFENISISGYNHSLKLDTEYYIRLNVDGSIINFYVNDVLVTSTSQAYIKKAQLQMFLSGECDIQIKNFEVSQEKSKIFVIMQFTEEFDNLYAQVIKPICINFGMECIRADECNSTGLILNDIIQSIKEASIIIADITPNNPNVFYEVGYAHAINKPTILLSDRKRDKLPFDVSGFRTIFYDNTIPGKTNIEKSLIKILENITSIKYKVNN